MRRPTRLDYAYAVGRVRALECQLISKPVFMEAAEEEEFPSVLKVLFEAGQFQEQKLEIQNSEQLDEFLEKEQQVLDRLMSEVLLEEEIREIAAEESTLEEMLPLSETLNYPFITDYLRHRIDLGNLKILSRVKYLDLSRNRLEMILMRGGFLDAGFFLDGFDLAFAEVGDRLKASSYQPIWLRGTDELLERETFLVLEREQENFLMRYLRKAKYIVFGPEPVFAYILAKKKELQLIRLLGVGKINRIPAEIIKERISETYV